MWLLSLSIASAAPADPHREASPPPVEETPSYAQRVEDLRRDREPLAEALAAGQDAAQVRGEARARLHRGIRELIDPWIGTPWDFYGTSETPGQGEIACGYFVSTVLRDAGLNVERVRMAQQASEHIILSLSDEGGVRRWRDQPVEAVISAIEAAGPGVAIVGLDYHVGMLVHDGERVEFCHSSWVGASGVVCEDPRTSDALPSRYTVVGWLSDDALVDAWLTQAPIPTVTQ